MGMPSSHYGRGTTGSTTTCASSTLGARISSTSRCVEAQYIKHVCFLKVLLPLVHSAQALSEESVTDISLPLD